MIEIEDWEFEPGKVQLGLSAHWLTRKQQQPDDETVEARYQAPLTNRGKFNFLRILIQRRKNKWRF
jgi:hypothetical protein